MKITIAGGAGCVGSCAAYRLAQDGFASEIVLLDSRRNVAEAHALDVEQAVVHRTRTRVRAGDVEDTAGSDVIIIAVGVWGRSPTPSRAHNLQQNVGLVLDLVRSLHAHSPSAFWMVVTTPVDALVHLIHRIFSIPREKVIGINRNDTSRVRWSIGKVLSVPATDVEAYVLGEHGDTQVHLLSRVSVAGKRVSLDTHQKEQVKSKITNFLSQWHQLQSGRTAGWATAESIGDIITSMASRDGRVWACATPLQGEYGLRDVSLGVPVRFAPGGVAEIVEYEMDLAERSGLELSAKAIKEQIKKGEALLAESAGVINELLSSLQQGGGKS
ncbi:MAG TPA: NAD-dependent epimerase/dehydratase family protein [Syntrophorhabdales bacterium]|nr:NAD-dependent epimerase/dehydratase family protein [Syntrophorhabdales bacterium]